MLGVDGDRIQVVRVIAVIPDMVEDVLHVHADAPRIGSIKPLFQFPPGIRERPSVSQRPCPAAESAQSSPQATGASAVTHTKLPIPDYPAAGNPGPLTPQTRLNCFAASGGGARAADVVCSSRTRTCPRILAISHGSSIDAMTRNFPPQSGQVSISTR